MVASQLWGLVLAGGDGRRLEALTRLVMGRPVPKQYCRFLGERSLLEATLDRVEPLVPPARTLAVVTRSHLPLARPQLARLAAADVVVQPRNLDTGPGLVLGLVALARRDPAATAAVFPSDHDVRDEAAFRADVARMAANVARRPERVALLGVRPERIDPGFGYVLPGSRNGGTDMLDVIGFHEKPEMAVAARLVARGALWNTFVMVGRVRRLLEIVAMQHPGTLRLLARADARVPAWNFSRDLLARVPGELAVLPATPCGWSDLGTPDAVERALAARGLEPPWRLPVRASA
jgi:mannose-1-phosphate guanylyltransferase